MAQTSFLGDLEKTITINHLMSIPFAERDENWRNDFLLNICGANLKIGEPQVVMSDDGFPYINLQTVSTGESFQAYVIENQLDVLLQQGFGIIINPQNEQLDWVFSYGDLVNLKLSGEFYSKQTLFSPTKSYLGIGKDEEILVGQPSENIFPYYLKAHIREFLQYSGVKLPKIMLIARNYQSEENVSQDLVFNITPAQFASEKDFNNIMNTLQWFLPKHYSFFGVDEMSINNGFQIL